MNKKHDAHNPMVASFNHHFLDVVIPHDSKISYTPGIFLSGIQFHAHRENGERVDIFMHNFGRHADIGEHVRHLEHAQKHSTVVALQGIRSSTRGFYVLTKEPEYRPGTQILPVPYV